MFGLPRHGAEGAGLPLAELGYRILASSISAWAFRRALKQSYGCLARGVPDPLMAGTTHKAEQNAVHDERGGSRLMAARREVTLRDSLRPRGAGLRYSRTPAPARA